jgi:hypothetical protein
MAGGSATAGSSAASVAGDGTGGAGGGRAAAGSSGTGPGENVYVDQLGARDGCLPRALPVAQSTDEHFEAGQVRCSLSLVTVLGGDDTCTCDESQNLSPSPSALAHAIAEQAQQSGACGGSSGVDCQRLCACNLGQASGAVLEQCQTNSRTPLNEMPPGFCYVDIDVRPSLATSAIVGACPASSRRTVRIMGPTPDPAPLMFLACDNQPLAP